MNLKDLDQEILNDSILSRLSSLAKREKAAFFLVGGYLRDLVLRKKRKDYDFALSREAISFIHTIEEALQLHFFRIGKEEETTTFRIIKNELTMDITLFQGKILEEDLRRRDFTMNYLAYSLRDGTWHWAEGALEDIEQRRIRAVSDRSFDLDPLRMLRAIRYVCTLGDFSMDRKLSEEITSKMDLILRIPGERIKMELDQILLSTRRHAGLKILYETGLLITLFPELKGLDYLVQDEHHHLDALSHTLLALDKISWAIEWMSFKGFDLSLSQEDLICLGYAILFHDIGKQNTYSKDEKGEVHFYHHKSFSCDAATRIMERLRFSNLLRDKVLHIIQNHMKILNLSGETKEMALKRLIHQLGEETPLLVIHSLSDKEASRGVLSHQDDDVVESHCLHLLELFRQEEVVHPPPLITGNDVLALGYLAGPRVGQIRNIIRQRQVEGEIKTREEAIRMLREKFSLE